MEKTKVQELEVLNGYYNSGANQIVIVYGHIRTGSATVITTFAKDKDYLYYCACSASERLQQYLMGDQLRSYGYDVSEYPSYKEIFETIEQHAVKLGKPLVVFIEKFEDIVKASPHFIDERRKLRLIKVK